MSEPLDEPRDDEPDDDEQEDELEAIDGPDDPTLAAEAERDGSAEIIAKAEKANQNYTKRLRVIFGPDTPLYDCPACDGLGVRFTEDEPALERTDAIRGEDTEPCDKCNALGLTLTGSKQPGYETKPCLGCSGRGYKDVTGPPAPPLAYLQPPAETPQPVSGQWVPGKGFIPYGATEPVPGSLASA